MLKKSPLKVMNGYNKLIQKVSKTQFTKTNEKYQSGKGTKLEKAILYLFYNKVHGIRKGLFPTDKNFKPIDIKDYPIFFMWIKETEFTNQDYTEIFKKYKSKVMLVINKNAITSFIYSKFIVGEYDKTYQLTKKKTVHIIACNY